MPSSEVVSDTGPFISLEKVPDGFHLLRLLFTKVTIPQAVLDELQAGPQQQEYLQAHGLSDLVEVAAEDQPERENPKLRNLDRGERAAIELAAARGCPLLIEERAGRKAASEMGVAVVVGAAALISNAHRRGLIDSAQARSFAAGLYQARRIGEHLYEELLQRVGDSDEE